METALSIVRFLHYSAAIQLFGMAVFETWIASASLSASLLSTARRIAIFNAWLLLLSAVLWLAFEAGSMGNGWADTINPPVIWLVITATGFGPVWVVNLVLGAAAVLVAHLLGPRAWGALAIVSTFCLGALAFVGHAVAESGAIGLLSRASQVVHLLSSGFWFGSLLSLVLVLRQIRDPRYAADTDVALRRFSGLGHAAVALALASGLANSWFVLRDSPLTLTSTYQLLLVIKVALVGSMCVLALVNRYVFMPAIPAGDFSARRLRDGTIGELIIGTGVIGIVSVLGLLSPS
jgi:putative copper resistance protein D